MARGWTYEGGNCRYGYLSHTILSHLWWLARVISVLTYMLPSTVSHSSVSAILVPLTVAVARDMMIFLDSILDFRGNVEQSSSSKPFDYIDV